ncbi:MAG: glycoside hydrolase family 3 protein [Clostridiales bacterium]|nr:glycoside hydrolase family 3 protein [Clostridiales bacterium]
MNNITKLTRQSAADGMVLLKNEGQVLPIKKDETLSIFGRCQIEYYRSGTGSGGAVNTEYTVNAVEGLKNSNACMINQELLNTYKTWLEKNPFDNGGGGWAAEPWFQKEMPLTDNLVEKASMISDKALIIIGRTAGEDQDNADKPGSYQLTTEELDILSKVTTYFKEVVVILNVSNIIDMSWVDNPEYKYPIKAVLYAWHGGMEGGNALADILTATVTPSGKLTDTIAHKLSDYPSSNQFGDDVQNFYEEDIYIGYKYFETFKPEVVQYPFGFGLSYTTFETTLNYVKEKNIDGNNIIEVCVEVKNTGDLYSGKEIVQLYYQAPQGLLGQPVKTLGSFKKTKLLKPNETEQLILTLKVSDMASYDDGGYTGYKSAYVLEAGLYQFYLGSDVTTSKLIEVDGNPGLTIENLMLIEQLEEVMAPVQAFKRMKPGKKLNSGIYELTYQDVPLKKASTEDRMNERAPHPLTRTDDKEYTLKDVSKGLTTIENFVAQLSDEELATLVKAEGMSSPKVTAGTAAAFGGLTPSLESYGIPVGCAADGPSGIRMDSGHKATQVAIGTLLACTWDLKLVEELYEEVGHELIENEIDTLLGPGLNIHRHPLNGRNFEYFSEDPLVTGLFATAMTVGLRNGGSVATLKHFVANDQESNRHLSDSIVSERALRETNLKGFEYAVKYGKAKSIMTSYNPINGIYAASNYDLNTTVLRGEWGFKGIVMTDWWARVNHPETGGKWSTYHKSYMVKAQNDLYMVVDNDSVQYFEDDDLLIALESGTLTRAEIQRSAVNICEFLMETPCFNREHNKAFYKVYHANELPLSKTVCEHSEAIALNTDENITYSLHVMDTGRYNVNIKMRYSASSLAQAAYNLLINNEYVATIQLHGTDNKWKSSFLYTVNLEPGYYEIGFDFVRPGIEVGEVKFSKV